MIEARKQRDDALALAVQPQGTPVTEGTDEFALINRLAALLDPPTHGIGIGDDAATWSPTPGTVTVATTDMLVEGIHFRLDWTTPEDLGWKAMAVNLSDIAAMGARPRHALVSIALKPDQAGIVIEIYKGIAAHARASGTFVVGGDTVRTDGPLTINVTLLGEADPALILRRDGARPGDVLAITGTAGGSAAGLALLSGEPTDSDPDRSRRLLAMHHRPSPRLHAGPALASLGARCGIDISDGIASETGHLARSSNVAIVIDVDAVPFHPDAVAMFGLERARTLGLNGGEDYELLVTLPLSLVDRARDAIASETTLTMIGRVVQDQHGGLVTATSGGLPFTLGAGGYVAF